LSEEQINAFIDDYAQLLNEAQSMHFAKWNKLFNGKDQSLTWFSAYTVSSYAQEIETLKKWFSKRLAFIDANLGGTCVLSSINNDISIFDVSVYPNPVSDQLIVESTKLLKLIEIVYVSGLKMTSVNLLNSNRAMLSEFDQYPKGIYKLLVFTVDGSCVSKTIVKK